MSGHSLNSPSSFSRRIGCPGSANMERDLPEETSPYAAEGTAAHALGEACLLNKRDPIEYVDFEIEGFIVDAEMVDAVRIYTDYCRQFAGNHLVEHKYELPFLGPEEKGTADFSAVHDGILHVIDYKHGKGVPVDAIGNIQGLCYGLGAAKHFEKDEWHTLRITIVQPRAYHDDGPIRSWDVPRNELVDYMVDFAYHAKATENPDAPLNVGSWCRFCKAKPKCPAQMKFAQEAMEMDFSEETSKPVPVDFLSDKQIADLVLNKVKIIEQWCASIKDYAQNKAEAGTPLPGTKLVATREVRMWKDKDQAEKVLKNKYGEQIYKKSFMSAPQVEKALGKKEFENVAFLVDKVSTGVTLVPESDPRKSVRQSVEDEFSDFN